jgi:hypothetical protein
MEEEKPPVFGKWSSWYWLVMSLLLLEVILFFLITFSFS